MTRVRDKNSCLRLFKVGLLCLTNGWERPKIDPLLPKFIAVQYLFRARYNICGANSFIALLHLFSSWCAVAKRRGGGFYLSSNKWCGPVVRIISLLAAYARAALCPFISKQLGREKWSEFYRSCSFSVKDNWCFSLQLVPCARTKTFGAFTYLFRSVRYNRRPVLTYTIT